MGRGNKKVIDELYLGLVKDVLTNGELKPTRAKIDGKNISAYSVFGRQARFDLKSGFPILTTKKVSFQNIAHELVWFLSGSSSIKYLRENNVNIWDAWADKNDELGYGTYGTLWRGFPFHVSSDEFYKFYPDGLEDYCFNSFKALDDYKNPEKRKKWPAIKHICYEDDVDGSVDQIKQLLENIIKVKKDPTASCGRRLIVSAWHPYYIDKVGLPPCHCLFQFNVTGNKLSCQLYQRSCDLFLGVPYNITSYSLLTYIIAHLTGLQASEFIHTYGDLHIYENHINQLEEQLTRTSYQLPQLYIDPQLENIDDLSIKDLVLINYQSWPALRGEVAV